MDPTLFGMEVEYNFGVVHPPLRADEEDRSAAVDGAGGRFYIDGTYMEYATPETPRPKEVDVKKETQFIDVPAIRKGRLDVGSAWADLQVDAVDEIEARSAAVDAGFDSVAEGYQESVTAVEVQSRTEGNRAEGDGE